MKISKQQLTNPGVIDASEKRKKQFRRYKEAVQRARFLSASGKKNWTILGYLLEFKQLIKAEQMIISEDLRLLKIKQDLERIKPKPQKNV